VSRICGIVRPESSSDEIAACLGRLLAPLTPCRDFSHEQWAATGVGFGRVYFTNLNFSTHLYKSPDNTIVCAFSGYFRDLEDLRSRVNRETGGRTAAGTPAEIVACLLKANGAPALADLSGSYVFALWDSHARTLQLGTDRFGMIPLYYCQRGRQIAFASQIKALLNLESDSGVNLAAVQELFQLGSPMGDQTLYPSVLRLLPATVMTFHDGQVTTERYWWYDRTQIDSNLDVPEFVEEACRRLNRSINSLMRQVENPICLLSAGYDSRRIFLELVGHHKPLVAYTSPTVKPGAPFSCDVPIARALCAEFDVRHVAVDLPAASFSGDMSRWNSALLDYETDAHAWIMPLLAAIPTASGVNFDGLGGDALFEDNWTYAGEVAHMHDAAWLTQAALERFPDLWSAHFRLAPPKPTLRERLQHAIEAVPPIADRYAAFYFTNWTRRKTALFSQGLLTLKFDSVYPFLDYDLVDLVFSVPPMTKREHAVSLQMLHKMNPKLMQRIPTSHDDNMLTAPKESYRQYCDPVPAGYWHKSLVAQYRASAVDIAASRGEFSQLTQPAQIAATGTLALRPFGLSPKWFIDRCWRLRLAGLYALHRRTARNPEIAKALQESAQAYIYRTTG
jgi:asparagine synthetase B (glutamine-hydrolysing)